MRSNYNKMEYCLGNSFDLLSTSTILPVCQDSSVFRRRYLPLPITETLWKQFFSSSFLHVFLYFIFKKFSHSFRIYFRKRATFFIR